MTTSVRFSIYCTFTIVFLSNNIIENFAVMSAVSKRIDSNVIFYVVLWCSGVIPCDRGDVKHLKL